MTPRTLVLTPWFSPHNVTTWQEAICLVYLGKAEVVEAYDEIVRSPSVEMQIPAVVRLKRKLPGMQRGVKFSRRNVFTRDGYKCQYCGTRGELNKDHVVPRAQGGQTTWENIITACKGCNSRKRNRTPEQAGMPLRSVPVKPRSLPLGAGVEINVSHPLWAPYLGGSRQVGAVA